MAIDMMNEEELLGAEESFIADVQFALHNLLAQKDTSRSELAKLLGVSESRISQIFADNPKNLTLRTIARVFAVLGDRAHLTSEVLCKLIPVPGSSYAAQSVDDAKSEELLAVSEIDLLFREHLKLLQSAYEGEANDNHGECERVAA